MLVTCCVPPPVSKLQLQTQRTKRITDFFDPLPREVYVRAIAAMKDELQRVAQNWRCKSPHLDAWMLYVNCLSASHALAKPCCAW